MRIGLRVLPLLNIFDSLLISFGRTELAKQGTALGETWLIHGCRHREHDFLFR